MRHTCDNATALLGFERLGSAANGRCAVARINRGSVFRKAKVAPTNFRLAGQFNRIPFNSGFLRLSMPFANIYGITNGTEQMVMPQEGAQVATWANCRTCVGVA